MKIPLIIVAVVAVAAAAIFLFGLWPSGGDVIEPSSIESLGDSIPLEIPEPASDATLVDVGGHRLHIRTFGSGSPAIVIETGIGEDTRNWERVIDELSKDYLVVIYSRAGYGESDPGTMPRSADQVVRELSALLVASDVEPPYVLVGHSIGAIFATVHADEHPNLTDGLVLLDPPPIEFLKGKRFPELRTMADQMTEGFRREADEARNSGDARRAAYNDALASEHDEMFGSGWAMMASVDTFGDMPVVVVGSGIPNPSFGESAVAFQEFWRESNGDVAALSRRGMYMYAENSTHNIPGEAPDVVVEAVRYCIEESYKATHSDYYDTDK